MTSRKRVGPVLQRPREELQEVAVVVAVDQDAQVADPVAVLLDLADAVPDGLVVAVRHGAGTRAPLSRSRLDGLQDVLGAQGDVLHAGGQLKSMYSWIWLFLRLPPAR